MLHDNPGLKCVGQTTQSLSWWKHSWDIRTPPPVVDDIEGRRRTELDIKQETECSTNSRVTPMDVRIVNGALFQAHWDIFAFYKITEWVHLSAPAIACVLFINQWYRSTESLRWLPRERHHKLIFSAMYIEIKILLNVLPSSIIITEHILKDKTTSDIQIWAKVHVSVLVVMEAKTNYVRSYTLLKRYTFWLLISSVSPGDHKYVYIIQNDTVIRQDKCSLLDRVLQIL